MEEYKNNETSTNHRISTTGRSFTRMRKDNHSDCGVPAHVIMAAATGFANGANMAYLHHSRIDG
jgi:hypothetical protein